MGKKLECKRCHYELKGTENYCPICGLNLKEGMTKEEVINQIEYLINGEELHIKDDYFDSEVSIADKEALETVKTVYEGIVQKVPVKDLEVLCKSIVEHLKENYTPYCNVIISCNQIRITEDVLGISVKSND